MNTNVLRAVFTRNFISYFANPTGYVFICVFVLLSSTATFWPHDFFAANLANLDQLNWVFPLIMLIFVPAITMSVWSDERRQGTDELLLTIPARDFDIVLGKYLAAVAIFTISLLFSFGCNLIVLRFLGNPDIGLFISTYVGYWLIGLAMLAIGMTASFLTDNLTVGFVFGALFNTPLVLAAFADVLFPTDVAMQIRNWSISQQFMDFGRGVISLSGIVYFLAIVVVMLYVSMVLIGRRHWAQNWYVPGVHYLLRATSIVLVGVSAVIFFHVFDIRGDVTEEKLSQLSPETAKLLDDIDSERPVKVEAWVSAIVPDNYVQQQLNLLSALREMKAMAGGKMQLVIHDDIEQFSAEANRAEERFGIKPNRVFVEQQGSMVDKNIFMGAAITCGLERVVIPFFDERTPVEYELVRSICTVTQQERKTIGVIRTPAQICGGFTMNGPLSEWRIIRELRQMYNIEQIDLNEPIGKDFAEKYDAILAVQPSSLGPQPMNNFIEAIKSGVPTAIFEDPFPAFTPSVTATSQPLPPPMQNPMMMMGQRPQSPPKGDISALWRLLGVDFVADKIIWKDYNPYPKISDLLGGEFVSVDRSGAKKPFDDDNPISAQLELIVMPFPGSFTRSPAAAKTLKFDPLIRTGEENTGTVAFDDILTRGPFGQQMLNPQRRKLPTDNSYILAAHIHGETEAPAPLPPGVPHAMPGNTVKADINVVLSTSVDMIADQFFRIRESANPALGIDFNFDNVTYVLNVLDVLAGDERFVGIRGRRPHHRTLTRIDELTRDKKEEANKKRQELQEEFDAEQKKQQEALDESMRKLRERMQSQKVSDAQIMRDVATALKSGQDRMQKAIDVISEKHKADVQKMETQLAENIRETQFSYKMWAVILPPIPPLLLAAVVFFIRRSKEKEGVAKSRMR